MTKLEQLIEELCPNGVEYRKLSEVTTIERGKRVVKEQLSHDSGYPVFQNSLTPMGFHTDSNYPAETSYVIGAGAAGEIGYCKEDFWAADDCFPIVCGDSVINRYVYHFLLWQQPVLLSKVRKASIPRLSRSVIENLMIPIPPLPVQSEIVRILDNFTELTAELTANLAAEFVARKKQYEYYRDALIQRACSDGIEYQTFGQMATIVRGASPRPIKNFVTTEDDGVNWIKIGDVKPGSKYITETAEKITPDGARKSRFVKEGDFILSNSMSFGRPYIMQTHGCIHDGWLAISDFENYFIPDFLYHLLSSNHYQQIMRQKASFGGAVQNLNADIVRALELPVLDISKQKSIVSILDRLDALCGNLASGLSIEIEERQQQYEYYRDKLLTFKEVS